MNKLSKEKNLRKKRYKYTIGIDEAGRGALAGPVVAAAVFCKNFKKIPLATLKEINNSKKIAENKREKIFNKLWNQKGIYWRTGKISHKRIDEINILNATKLAMREALSNLKRSYNLNDKNSFLILDGNFTIENSLNQEAVIQGDDKIFSCMLASIIAKVTRDRLMRKLSDIYSGYGFKQHKGYGTKDHIKQINKKGACFVHRKSFGPLA